MGDILHIIADTLKNKTAPYKFKMDISSFVTKISDDVTLIMSPEIYFSMPPSYKYMVLETGDIFYSQYANEQLAYQTWKENKIIPEHQGFISNIPPMKKTATKCDPLGMF